MADTSTFMAIGQMPQVDYGAVYRNAKARRELEEEKKLAYLNQFQQQRGAFTEGMQDSLQEEWDAIEADLDTGDMSFEAKARRQRMYNVYKQHAADALEYAQNVNNLEASILADPTAYNDPAAIMQDLADARQVQASGDGIGIATGMLPSLNEFRRFSLPEISPNAAAGMIMENLKASGGINDFYDMGGTGELSPEQVAASVTAWFNSNALSQEEEDQAIAFVLHQLGGLSGSMEDISKIRNLTDEEREQYIGQYAQYVTSSLTNMLADDIETQKEKDARDFADFRRRARVQAQESAAAEAASGGESFTILDGSVQYMPAIEETNGVFIKRQDPELVDAGLVIHAKIEGTQPSYRDENGNKFFIESIGVDDTGQSVAVVRTDQKVITSKNKSVTHPAHTVVSIRDIPMTGLSNAAQARRIQNTYDRMGAYYTQNIAGTQPGAAPVDNYASMTDAITESYISENQVNQPSPRPGVDDNPFLASENFAPAPLKFDDINSNSWNKMSFNEKSNYILEKAKERNSEMVVSNPNTGRETEKWNTMTPTERQAALRQIEKELSRELGGKFDRSYNLIAQ